MALKNRRWLLLPACLLLGVAILIAFVKTSQSYLSDYLIRNSKPLIGQKLDLEPLGRHLEAPQITPNLNSPLVLVFWSMSCAPCLKNLGKLQDLHPGALVVAINTDESGDLEQARKISKELAPEQSFHHDKNRFLEKTLKIDYLPTHVLINNEGFIEKFEVSTPEV